MGAGLNFGSDGREWGGNPVLCRAVVGTPGPIMTLSFDTLCHFELRYIGLQ